MPLEKGPGKAKFSRNVATEVEAGKPQKQAVAIAYRESGEKRGDENTAAASSPVPPRPSRDALQTAPNSAAPAGRRSYDGGSRAAPWGGRTV